jgi:N-acetylglucosamine-6-sulfatase
MTSRRSFLRGVSAQSLAAIGGKATPARPNIIVILTDDQRWDAFSGYGKPSVLNFMKTPNMDRLATEGAHFRNTFVTTSLCSPSRASIMTGKYVHSHGVVALEMRPKPDCRLFPALLRESGYDTGFVGKWHLGVESDIPDSAFTSWAGFKNQGTYLDVLLNVNGTRTPTHGYVTDVLTDHAIDFISEKRDKPFFLHFAHKAPHGPCIPPKELETLYEDVDVALPATYYESLDDKPAWFANCHDHDAFHVQFHPKSKYQAWVRNYCRTLVSVDQNLGRLLKVIEDKGLTENTVIFYLSDNGHFLAEHQLLSKMLPYEESMRIPLLVRWPGKIPASLKRDEIVLNVDLAPTILEIAGVAVPRDMEGRSFTRMLRGQKIKDWRQSFFYEYFAGGGWGIPSLETVRTVDGWKYTRYPDWEQLFWLEEDPFELRNLAANPKYAAKKRALVQELHQLGGGKNLAPAKPYKRGSEPVHTPHPPDFQ